MRSSWIYHELLLNLGISYNFKSLLRHLPTLIVQPKGLYLGCIDFGDTRIASLEYVGKFVTNALLQERNFLSKRFSVRKVYRGNRNLESRATKVLSNRKLGTLLVLLNYTRGSDQRLDNDDW